MAGQPAPRLAREAPLRRRGGRGAQVVTGGSFDERKVAPTILDGVPPDAPIMQEEIFGRCCR